MTEPKTQGREVRLRQLRQITRAGRLNLPQKYMRLIGARPGDRLKIACAPGKVVLTLVSEPRPGPFGPPR